MSIVSQQRSTVSSRVALGMLFAVFAFFLAVQTVSADESGAAAIPVAVSEEAAVVGGAAAIDPDAGEASVKKKKKKKKKKKNDFRVYWKNGLRFRSNDRNFRVRIGGNMQLDAGIVTPSKSLQQEFGIDSQENDVRFRRARLKLEGTIYKIFDFKFQYGFVDGNSGIKDAYIAVRKVPFLQRIQVGQFKEPFSLERLTSSNNVTFMERSLQSGLEPRRNPGIGAYMHFLDKRMTAAMGAFRIANGLGEAFSGGSPYSLAARVTGLPWYEDKGEKLLHLGMSYAFDFRNGDEIRIRQRPSTKFGPRLVDTGKFITNDIVYLDPEIALVLGPLSVQAEYLHTFLNQQYIGDPQFTGWYVETSYFLTGEHRPYSRREAKFKRLKPHHNFGWGEGSGWGAFQVAARVSQLDLNSGDVDGGRMQDVTFGLNWYLNPVVRVMFNYVYGDREDEPGSENVYQLRFQTSF
jgi:phosphate-selective porin OprO/OprP